MRKLEVNTAIHCCPKCNSPMKRNGKTNHRLRPVQKYKCTNCGFCSTMTGRVGRPRNEGLCFCGKEARVKGLCRSHYQRLWIESNSLTRAWYKHQEQVKMG